MKNKKKKKKKKKNQKNSGPNKYALDQISSG